MASALVLGLSISTGGGEQEGGYGRKCAEVTVVFAGNLKLVKMQELVH